LFQASDPDAFYLCSITPYIRKTMTPRPSPSVTAKPRRKWALSQQVIRRRGRYSPARPRSTRAISRTSNQPWRWNPRAWGPAPGHRPGGNRAGPTAIPTFARFRNESTPPLMVNGVPVLDGRRAARRHGRRCRDRAKQVVDMERHGTNRAVTTKGARGRNAGPRASAYWTDGREGSGYSSSRPASSWSRSMPRPARWCRSFGKQWRGRSQ